jgi:hypothetical protein
VKRFAGETVTAPLAEIQAAIGRHLDRRAATAAASTSTAVEGE